MSAWKNWYHCNTHTYGVWLPGDPRGWRSRDHKTHVDGDYKNPPPAGRDRGLLQYAQESMTRSAVKIPAEVRQFLLDAAIVRIREMGIVPAVASLDATHLHILFPCATGNPKIVMGIVKQYATAQLKAHRLDGGLNLQLGEGLWAKGSHAKPINSLGHWDNSRKYILDHVLEEAVVWENPVLTP